MNKIKRFFWILWLETKDAFPFLFEFLTQTCKVETLKQNKGKDRFEFVPYIHDVVGISKGLKKEIKNRLQGQTPYISIIPVPWEGKKVIEFIFHFSVLGRKAYVPIKFTEQMLMESQSAEYICQSFLKMKKEFIKRQPVKVHEQ